MKHARAAGALVEIKRTGRRLQVVIADDGQGFLPATPAGGPAPVTGQGLAGIVERARTLGGTAVIHSRPGSGTRVEISVPIA